MPSTDPAAPRKMFPPPTTRAICAPRLDTSAISSEIVRERLGLTSLRYQRLDDLVEAIGLPKEKLCTFCWDGVEA